LCGVQDLGAGRDQRQYTPLLLACHTMLAMVLI
jgi:hypothetical protein